ncbi:hypothetical protein HDU98_007827 [Podochytrium sp. JEL0797]|nr:hypothetical protein HDU98_007827 [Podochytrium sp. JEL0797]
MPPANKRAKTEPEDAVKNPEQEEQEETPEESEESDEAEDEDDFGDDGPGCYRKLCQKSFAKHAAKVADTKVQAAAVVALLRVAVGNANYEDDADVRSVDCAATLQRASFALRLDFDYHHRARSSFVEHRVQLKYALGEDKHKVLINNTLMPTPRGATSYDDYDEPCVEKRKFVMPKTTLTKIRKALFDGVVTTRGKPISLLNTLLLMYAAVGIAYDGFLDGHCSAVALRDSWLEHYSRKAAGCLNDEDKGYETEDPKQQMRDWVEMKREQRCEMSGGSDSDREGFDDGMRPNCVVM